MKRLIAAALCGFVIAGLAACGGETGRDPEQPSGKGAGAALSHAVVGTWKTPQTIQPFFYEEFSAGALTAEILPFTNPGDMKTAFLAGSLDLCGTTIVTAITAASKGEPVVIVSGLANKCSALVVAAGSGIEKVEDLKGKKIAYVPGTMHHLLLLEALQKGGLDPETDVELVRIDFFDMGQALAQGQIDAFYSGEPYPSMAVAQGTGIVLLYPEDGDGFGIINSAMITTREKLREEPELIRELVLAHVRATEYLNAHRDAWLDKSEEFGTQRPVLEVAADNIQLFWRIDEAYLDSVRRLAQRMKDQGLITEVPEMEAMFDLRFLEEAEKELNGE